MGLADQMIADVFQITTDGDGWGVSISFQSPDNVTAVINGLATKHHLGIDDQGNAVNSKKASIAFSEKALTDVGYPVRDASGAVNLRGHKVTWKDSSGAICKYVIKEWFPDETVGLIPCILGDFQ